MEIYFVALYPPFRARGFTYLHDPLAVATILAPDLVTWRTLRVDVEMSGRLTAGMTLMREPSDAAPANARVALAHRYSTGRVSGCARQCPGCTPG